MQRILIFRPDNIGDVLLFSGALRHIRRLYPDAHITLAVQKHIVNLVELCPSIDKCISLEDLNWWLKVKDLPVPYMAELESALRKLDRYWKLISKPFDLVIFPVKSPQRHHLFMLYDLGINKVYGIVGCILNVPRGGYPAHIDPKSFFSDYLDVTKEDPWQHEFLTTLDFLKFLGSDVSQVSDIEPEIRISGSDRNLLKNEQNKNRKIIGLFPGASVNARCWDPVNYEHFSKLMGDNFLYAIFGGLEDASIALEVEYYLQKGCPDSEVINLVGKTTLRELYRTISACDLFIGMETSGLHLAIAADIPTIGITGGGHYGRFIPWGEPERHLFLTEKLGCFCCNWKCKNERYACIQELLPEEVANCAKRLLLAHMT